MAILPDISEEAEFINTTVLIPSKDDCRYRAEKSQLPWIIGKLI